MLMQATMRASAWHSTLCDLRASCAASSCGCGCCARRHRSSCTSAAQVHMSISGIKAAWRQLVAGGYVHYSVLADATSLAFRGTGRPQNEQQRGLRAVPLAAAAGLQVPLHCAMQVAAANCSAAQPPDAAQRRAAQLAAPRKVHHERQLHLRRQGLPDQSRSSKMARQSDGTGVLDRSSLLEAVIGSLRCSTADGLHHGVKFQALRVCCGAPTFGSTNASGSGCGTTAAAIACGCSGRRSFFRGPAG